MHYACDDYTNDIVLKGSIQSCMFQAKPSAASSPAIKIYSSYVKKTWKWIYRLIFVLFLLTLMFINQTVYFPLDNGEKRVLSKCAE